MSRRAALIAELAASIQALHPRHRIRVAIDGVDGVGKTTFAGELAGSLTGRPVVRASVDGFHRPAAERYRRGRDSPEGFYLDSYDYPALRTQLLEPFGRHGNGQYRSAVFAHPTDRPLHCPTRTAPPAAVLLLDGIFLHRPELARYWDLSILLTADFAITIPRGAGRGPGYGSPDPAADSNRRYVEGQRRYLYRVRPAELASVVIDNTVLDRPRVLARRPAT